MKPSVDPRDPRPCRWCGQRLAYDGWDMVHNSGRGEGSDPADEPAGNPQHPWWRTFTQEKR